MRTKPILTITVLLIVMAAYFHFRPDRMFVDARQEIPTSKIERHPSGIDRQEKAAQVVLAEGEFHDLEHTGAGQVKILADDKGQRVLQFLEFETAPGKDLMVCLMPLDDRQNPEQTKPSPYIIAPLKEIMGDQSYDLPPNLELSKCKEVMIWSRSSGVNFAKAVLHFH